MAQRRPDYFIHPGVERPLLILTPSRPGTAISERLRTSCSALVAGRQARWLSDSPHRTGSPARRRQAP